jgi:uncharacterized YigZ family protein
MEDRYLEIARESHIEIKIKGSRFIGETRLVSSAENAAAKLEEIRKREHSATHHCYAWQVGLAVDTVFKYSDDGEPTGTAGKPIYDVLVGSDLTNVLVVVTRYYGGTKLGTGGLVHAYGDAAREAIAASGVKERFLTDDYRMDIAFPHYDRLQQLLQRLEISIIDSRFTDQVSLDVRVRRSRSEQLMKSFIDLTSGRGSIEQIATKDN